MNKFNKMYESFKTLTEETKPTEEMIEWFKIRTDKHIKSVQDNWRKLYDSKFSKYLNELPDKEEHILKHDASKYESVEYLPYVFTTHSYRMKDEGEAYEIPEGMKEKADEATWHHIKNNSHHPEYWDESLTENPINSDDRDKVGDIVTDATKMENWALCEMITDHKAVSDERGTSLRNWEDTNIGSDKRWKFSKTQTKLIYDLIKFFTEK